TDEEDVELRDIRIRRYQVTGIVAVEEAPYHRIGLGLLEQGLPHAPDDAPDGLAARGLGIDDPAGVVGADKAAQADQPEVRVDAYFREDGGETEDRLRSVRLRDRIVISVGYQRGKSVAREQIGIGYVQVLSRQHQPAVCDDHVFHGRAGEGRLGTGQGQQDR